MINFFRVNCSRASLRLIALCRQKGSVLTESKDWTYMEIQPTMNGICQSLDLQLGKLSPGTRRQVICMHRLLHSFCSLIVYNTISVCEHGIRRTDQCKQVWFWCREIAKRPDHLEGMLPVIYFAGGLIWLQLKSAWQNASRINISQAIPMRA